MVMAVPRNSFGWPVFGMVSSHPKPCQELSQAMPEATVWASAASKAKIGKVTVAKLRTLSLPGSRSM